MITWKHCTYAYDKLCVLDDFSFALNEKGLTVFLGPSGCGKTTLLNLAARLLHPQKGSIQNGSSELSYLFQKPRLLPWKTVRENICFALPDDMSDDQKKIKTDSMIKLVGLQGFEDYLPFRLSGGMEQRCAIARAFVTERPFLLMDEPFKGLDLKLKMPLISLLNKLLEDHSTSAVLVTHDVREAILMGDRIVYLDGPPLKIIEDLDGIIPPEERHTASRKFYEMEKKLYNLILNS